MQTDIHPKYYPKAEVSCACGNKFNIGSTKEKVAVEICYNCHPFYTGKKKVVDAVGKVEKFKSRRAKASAEKPKSKAAKKTAKKAAKKEKKVGKK